MTSSMKAVVVPEVKGAWVLQDRPRPMVGPGQVLVKVHACGICGTDLWLAHGTLKFRDFPLVLGHEGVGEVVAVGEGVTERRVGDRVGMPMMQKACGRCDFCRGHHVNSFVTAANCASPTLTGVNVDGAQAEYMLAPADGTILLPDGVSYENAAPSSVQGIPCGPRFAAPLHSPPPVSRSSESAASVTSRFNTPRRPASVWLP